jgi:hypothetical protein
VVDAFDAKGEHSLGATLDLGDLVQLVDWLRVTSEASQYTHGRNTQASAADEGALEQFLRERKVAREESREGELVGAR